MEKLVNEYTEDVDAILPAPELFESAKAYRTKKAMPIYRKIIQTLRSVYHSYLDLKSKYARLENSYNREVAKNKSLTSKIQTLSDENRRLKSDLRDYDRVKQAYGPEIAATVQAMIGQEQQNRKQTIRRDDR